jgi:hypothetical protein
MITKTYRELEKQRNMWFIIAIIAILFYFMSELLSGVPLGKYNELKAEKELLQNKLESCDNTYWTLKLNCKMGGARFIIEKDFNNYTEYKDASNLIKENLDNFSNEFESCEVIE